MNILIIGAAGFIGTNLTINLAKNEDNHITLVDEKLEFFKDISSMHLKNISIKEYSININTDFNVLLKNQDIIYHLMSTTIPGTSNQHISQELMANVITTSNLLEAAVNNNIKQVVYISSGGSIYGKNVECPISESTETYPISSYGLQKVTIEKLLYLYDYIYNLDYRVIRLANPYGPYQRPNGILGAVTTFTYKAIKGEPIIVYGDGTIIRDFIFIDDVVRAINNIVNTKQKYKIYNLGSGYGTSLKTVLSTIEKTLNITLNIEYKDARKVDVPVNYLDISRYESVFGKLNPISLSEGIKRTAMFMEKSK